MLKSPLTSVLKRVTHAHLGLIWYHSEPSDVPYSPNQFLALDFFFATSYSKKALGPLPNFKTSIYQSQLVTRALCCTNALQKKKFKVGQKKEHLLLSFYNA